MAIATRSHSITNATPSLLVPSKGATTQSRRQVIVSGASSDVYVGGFDVNSTTGALLQPGEWMSLELGVGDDVYGIADGPSATVRTLETRR